MPGGFRHRDAERTVVFGRGVIVQRDLLPEQFVLLSTPRATAAAPEIAERASLVLPVPPGAVPELAADLLERVDRSTPAIVALGGGRVIDVAKAVAAAIGSTGVTAIPTSLSGAEMTGVHRHAKGVEESTPRVRASVVVNDPALSASQPTDALAASSANALAHAIAAFTGLRSSPITRAVAADAVARFGQGWAGDEPDRDAVALGALLAGWAVDGSGLGAHHALAQTAVRMAQLPHAQTNAALLPVTTAALRSRDPEALRQLDGALGRSVESLASELRERAAAPTQSVATGELERIAEAAMGRPELARVQPAFDRDEVVEIYGQAFGGG